jgi:formamidopyrimidine-DNA glycosylase
MPELPEVETMRRDLQSLADRAVVTRAQVLDEKIIQGAARAFARRLRGRRLVRFDRRGKVLMLGLDDGSTLLAHPRMTGHWLGLEPGHELPAHPRVILHLDNGRRLVFDDSRRFGRLELAGAGCVAEACLLRNIGADALGMDAAALGQWLGRKRVPIKVALLDQRGVSGIGNIYASEILFGVGLDPRTPSCRVTQPELRAIARETERVLGQSIEYRGTTLMNYRTASGDQGEFRRKLRVYGRGGEPCRRKGCRGTIQRIVLGGRSTYYCSHCQRTGRTRRCVGPRRTP